MSYLPPPSPKPFGPLKHLPTRTVILKVLYIAGGLLLGVVWIWAQAHHGGNSSSRPPATRPSPAGPAAVTYVMKGSPANVTYGPAGVYYTGVVPMRVTQRLTSGGFYAIIAHPDGSGAVTCEMLVGGKVISKATAAGRNQLVFCSISQDQATGRWTGDNAMTGR